MKDSVLFLCTNNSCRSQMAEALLRRHTGHRFEVFSAGLRPREIHPLTYRVMAEIGIDISGHARKGSASSSVGCRWATPSSFVSGSSRNVRGSSPARWKSSTGRLTIRPQRLGAKKSSSPGSARSETRSTSAFGFGWSKTREPCQEMNGRYVTRQNRPDKSRLRFQSSPDDGLGRQGLRTRFLSDLGQYS